MRHPQKAPRCLRIRFLERFMTLVPERPHSCSGCASYGSAWQCRSEDRGRNNQDLPPTVATLQLQKWTWAVAPECWGPSWRRRSSQSCATHCQARWLSATTWTLGSKNLKTSFFWRIFSDICKKNYKVTEIVCFAFPRAARHVGSANETRKRKEALACPVSGWVDATRESHGPPAAN